MILVTGDVVGFLLGVCVCAWFGICFAVFVCECWVVLVYWFRLFWDVFVVGVLYFAVLWVWFRLVGLFVFGLFCGGFAWFWVGFRFWMVVCDWICLWVFSLGLWFMFGLIFCDFVR